MTTRKNPRIPEGINTTKESPLKEFSSLLIVFGLFAVVIVIVLTIFIRAISPYIPFSWELKIAKNFEQNLSSTPVEKSVSVTEAEYALQELVLSLSRKMELTEDIIFKIHFLDSETPNAFATLGGHIFVTKGLIKNVTSENALAMVIAHEMAHIKYRHPIQSLGRGALFSLILLVISGSQGTGVGQKVLGQSGLIALLRFSRDMEREADREAINTIKRHYGHIAGSDEFFSKMSRQSNSSEWATIFQTHPGVEERIAVIRDKMSTEPHKELIPLDRRIRQAGIN